LQGELWIEMVIIVTKCSLYWPENGTDR
jgi:hypothetical protein